MNIQPHLITKLPFFRLPPAFCLSVLFACSTAYADTSWKIEALMEAFSQVEHAKLDFVETKKSIFLITDTVLKGVMEYRAPDYIEKQTRTPFNERVVIDGDSMTIEKTPSMGKQEDVVIVQTYSVESHPVLKAAIESIRAMLAGNYEVLSDNYSIELKGQKQAWELTLKPKADDILQHIEAINLSGSDVRIRKVVTIRPDGDEATLELSYKFVN